MTCVHVNRACQSLAYDICVCLCRIRGEDPRPPDRVLLTAHIDEPAVCKAQALKAEVYEFVHVAGDHMRNVVTEEVAMPRCFKPVWQRVQNGTAASFRLNACGNTVYLSPASEPHLNLA